MGRPPIRVVINTSASFVGVAIAIVGGALHRPTIAFVGLAITSLAFVSSLVFFLHVRRGRNNDSRPNTP